MWTDENFKRASWVNVMNVIFHELAGYNVIMQYSNIILGLILGTDKTSGFTPREGTYVVGIVNFFASLVSVWTINNFGRRILLLLGHTGMAVVNGLIGLFIITGFDAGVLGGIAVFLILF